MSKKAQIQDLIDVILECPQDDPGHSHIDQTLLDKVKLLTSESKGSEVKLILDEAAFNGTASDFGMMVLMTLHSALTQENGE